MQMFLPQGAELSLSESAIKDRIKEGYRLLDNYDERKKKIINEIKQLQKQVDFTPTKRELKEKLDHAKLSNIQINDREKVLLKKYIQIKNDEMDISSELKHISEEIERRNPQR